MKQHVDIKKENDIYISTPFVDKGKFLYRQIDEIDYSVIKAGSITNLVEKSTKGPLRIICSSIGLAKNCPGSRKGRNFISIKGNVTGSIGVPKEFFPNRLSYEYFPFIVPIAIKDTCNKYAPGEYQVKYPNDIVCKKHWRKTSGIGVRSSEKYACAMFGVNLVDYPSDEEIRDFGIKACCLKKHTEKVPTIEEFLCACTERIIEYVTSYTTLDQIVNLVNENFRAYEKKSFFLEINNPNGNPEKDGAIYCPEYPNALTKGYVNGILYNIDEDLYDDNLENEDISKKDEKMYEIQLKEDQRIRKEIEEKEKKEE